jgi:hypothetical protein
MKNQILALLILFAGHALGSDLKKGDILNVKAGSLWFQTPESISVFQRFAAEISPDVALYLNRRLWPFTALNSWTDFTLNFGCRTVLKSFEELFGQQSRAQPCQAQ